MGKTEWQRLDATVASIQRRWGKDAIQKGWQREKSPSQLVTSVGQPCLDAMLEIGGLPRGHITEFIGRGTAGHLTLALSALCQAQQKRRHAAYIDLSHSIDLDYMARCGVRFDSLTIFRPHDVEQVLKIVRELGASGIGTIVLDRSNDLLVEFDSDQRLIKYLRNLRAIINQSGCILILLTDLAGNEYPDPVLPSYTSVRILCEHQRWKYRRKQVIGYTSRITILKNKFGRPGQSFVVAFPINQEGW